MTLDGKQSSPVGGRGLSFYAKCDVVDVNLHISLRVRKRQCVYQGMSSFECCVDVDVNCSFSLWLRLRASVPHDAPSCAGRYVLELKFFSLPSLASLIAHSFAFFSDLLSSRRAHWELHGASLGDKTSASGFLSGEQGIVIVRLLEPTAL